MCSEHLHYPYKGFPGSSDNKERLKCGRPRFNPWVRKIPWRRKWHGRIPCMEESGGLQSMGSKRVGHDWETNTFTFIVKQHHVTKSLFHNRMLTISYNWILYWNWKTEQLFGDRVIVSISDFYPQDLEADWEMRLPLPSITKEHCIVYG